MAAVATAADEQENLSYIIDHDMHHVFERLACEVLQQKPKKLVPFLIEVLQQMDGSQPSAEQAGPGKPAQEPTPPPAPEAEPEKPPAVPEKEEEEKPAPASPPPQTDPAPEKPEAAAASAAEAPAAPAEKEGGKEGDETKYDPTVSKPPGEKEDWGQKRMKTTIAAFGIGNAGKTTMLSAAAGEVEPDTTPTVGFDPKWMQAEKHDINFFDVGGGRRIRSVWQNYYADVHGVVYVVDAASDRETLEESAKEFKKMIADSRITGKPIVILANKQDLENVTGVAEIEKLFEVSGVEHVRVVECCALKPDHPTHENIVKTAIAWLLDQIEARHSELSARVKEEIALEKQKNKQRMAEQRARVMREKEERERQEREAEAAGAAG